MTQKCVYLSLCFSIATQQLSRLTGNQGIRLPVVINVQDGNMRVAVYIFHLAVWRKSFTVSASSLVGPPGPLQWFPCWMIIAFLYQSMWCHIFSNLLHVFCSSFFFFILALAKQGKMTSRTNLPQQLCVNGFMFSVQPERKCCSYIPAWLFTEEMYITSLRTISVSSLPWQH